MPLISSAGGLSSRALGLASGIIAGPATITSVSGVGNGTTGTELSVNFTAGRVGSSPVTNYEYSVDDGSTYTAFSPAQTTSPLIISGLTNGTTYQVKIRSLQGNQTSDASNSVNGRPVALPSAPVITAVANDVNSTTGQQVQVTFTASTAGTDAISNYQYSLDGGSTWTSPSPAVTTSPLTISSLTNGTSYSVALRALTSQSHTSVTSNTSTARPVALPGAPTISSITASTGQLSIAFSTGAPGTDAPQTYQYSLNDGSTWTNRATGTTASPIVVTGITDSTVVSGGYTVRIRQVTNQLHVSAQSNAVVPAATPAAAPVITSSSKTPTSITVNFTSAVAGSYAVSYHQRSLDGTNWSTYTSGSAITGLSTSTTYTVRIRAVDVQGVAGSIATTTVTTDAEVAPNAPSVSVSSSSTSSITITWTNNGGGTYGTTTHEYSVYYYHPSTGAWTTHTNWTSTTTSPITVGSLPYADYTYYIYMRAVANSPGVLKSSITSASSITMSPTPSAPSVSFSSTNSSERSTAYLSWSAISYATSYHIYRNGSYYSATSSTSASVAVGAGGTYTFNVYAINKHGTPSSASTTRTMVVGATGVAFSRSDTREIIMAGQGSCSDANSIRLRVGFPETVPDSSETAGYIAITSISHQAKKTYEGAITYTQSDDGTRRYYFFTTASNPGYWGYECNLHLTAIPRQALSASSYTTISSTCYVSGSALSGKEFFVGVICNEAGWNVYSGGCAEANITGFAAATHRIYNLVVSGTQTTASTYS